MVPSASDPAGSAPRVTTQSRRLVIALLAVAAMALLAGCSGWTTGATNITSNSARLKAVGSCGGGDCSAFIRWRQSGTNTWTNGTTITHIGKVSSLPWSWTATGLAAGKQYEYQECGKESSFGQQFVCVGPNGQTDTTSKFVTAGGSSVVRLDPVLYTEIQGQAETLTPWQGQHVTVLVDPGQARDATVMTNLVSALDRAWAYYATTTGQVPATLHSLNGRDEIAEVPDGSTCGAGCGYLGATGIEIQNSNFEYLYQQVAQNGLFDQVLFYELGRNFWFWSPQLQFHNDPYPESVVTGYAVLMRFLSMNAAGVGGSPFDMSTPFETFTSEVTALAGQYEANPSLTFADTLGKDASPGFGGGADFWASLMMQLARRHGGQTFYSRFFQHASSLPTESSTPGAVTNWLTDANYSACTDLSPVFYTRWGFPRPNGSVTSRPAASSVPEPIGSCSP